MNVLLVAWLMRFRADGPNSSKIAALKERLIELNAKALEIQANADAENRELTDDESEQVRLCMEEFEASEAEIKRREKLEAQQSRLAQPNPRQAPHNDPAPPAPSSHPANPRPIEPVHDRNPGRWGFNHIGDFAQAVVRASGPNPIMDNRLVIRNAPTTAGSEGVGTDGGFAVPPDFRQEIAEKVMEDPDNLLSRTDQMTSNSNTVVLPKDEDAPWDSTGIQAYWTDELAQLSQSKPNLTQATITLNKLTVLTPVSEELLQDSSMMDSYLRRKAPQRINWKVGQSIVRGDGVGKPQGILNANCAVTVAAESGPQAADTVVLQNVVKMYSRMPAANRRNAVWLMNQDIEPQLFQMTISGSSSGVFPVYLPPGGLSAAPYGTLMGRPVVPHEACSILGDAGDLIFADLTQYLTILKTGGPRVDVSMHLYFDYDAMAFRFILRIAGQPWWGEAWSRRDSNSPTLSPFVILGARTGS